MMHRQNLSIANMRYSIEGSLQAPVVVLANSLAATSAMWDSQCAVWCRHWRLVRFDYVGHDAPDFSGEAPKSVEEIGRDLIALLDLHGIQRFAFVGLSLGGMLGLHLAGVASDRVERLVVANCRYYQTESLQKQWDERVAIVHAGGIEAIADVTIERWLTAGYRLRSPERTAEVRAMVASTSRSGFLAAAGAVRDFDARPMLDQIRCPVMVVSGAQDGAAPSEHLAMLAAKLGARHLKLDPCAHLSCVECAEAFTDAAGAFLS